MPKSIYIIGSGGVGREILATLTTYFAKEFMVKGFIDDGKPVGTYVNRVMVVGGVEWLLQNTPSSSIIVAIGNPVVRMNIIEKLNLVGFDFPTIIHPTVVFDNKETCKIGRGCYIAAMNILTTDISIGDFCFINTHCSLQHDTVLEDNVTLMSGVRITGGANIGKGTYVSGNVLIADNRIISKDSRL